MMKHSETAEKQAKATAEQPVSCRNGCTWDSSLLSRYVVGRRLGSGTFGCVHYATNRATGKKVAIKKITDLSSGAPALINLVREIYLLGIFKGHTQIISLEHISRSASGDTIGQINLVFEYFPSDLFRVMVDNKGAITTEHIQYFLYQILLGVFSLHEANIVHRDLKPSNILAKGNCDIKICDLGMARLLKRENYQRHFTEFEPQQPPQLFRQLTPEVVTLWYRAPEVFTDGKAEAPSDMWSIGCIMAEFVLGYPLFPAKDDMEMVKTIFGLIADEGPCKFRWINSEKVAQYVSSKFSSTTSEQFDRLFLGKDPAAVALIKKLIVLDPSKRLTAKQALSDPFFKTLFDVEHLMSLSLPSTERSSLACHSALSPSPLTAPNISPNPVPSPQPIPSPTPYFAERISTCTSPSFSSDLRVDVNSSPTFYSSTRCTTTPSPSFYSGPSPSPSASPRPQQELDDEAFRNYCFFEDVLDEQANKRSANLIPFATNFILKEIKRYEDKNFLVRPIPVSANATALGLFHNEKKPDSTEQGGRPSPSGLI